MSVYRPPHHFPRRNRWVGTKTAAAPPAGKAPPLRRRRPALWCYEGEEFYPRPRARRLPPFTKAAPTTGPTQVSIAVREKPPLRHSYEVETPLGRFYRWAPDEADPRNVLNGPVWSSTMPGGYEQFDGSLPRKEGVDYDDLAELSTITAYSAGGNEPVGQFRLERSPRVSGDEVAISPSAPGWQAHLDDLGGIKQIYVDQDKSKWGAMSVQRRIDLITGSDGPADPAVVPDASTGAPSLQQAISGTWSISQDNEALYDARGVPIGDLYYAWKKSSNVNPVTAGWEWRAILLDDDVFTSFDQTANLKAAGPDSGILSATTDTRKFAVMQFFFGGAGGADGVEWDIFWTCLAVYGKTGLARQGDGDFTNAPGILTSDIVAHAVENYAPKLAFTTGPDGTIRPDNFVVPQAVYTDPTTASQIIKDATRFGLQDWAVWPVAASGIGAVPTFFWYPRNAIGKRWRARVRPAGLNETGPQVDRIFTEVIVQYQDVSGNARTVGPVGSGADTEDASLSDPDPLNPANEAGIQRRSLLSMGTSTAAAAIRIGQVFLQQSKLLDSSGDAQLIGWVEDDRGVLYPASRVRAGDAISFVDAAQTGYRRIVKASYAEASKTCSITLDSPPDALAALLERLGVVLVALGLN